MTVPPSGRSPGSPEGHDRVGRAGGGASDGPLSVLVLATWFGALAGLLEVLVLLAWHRIDNAAVLGALQMNRHFLWMIPVSHLSVFLTCGLPVALIARVRPGAARRGGVFLFSSLFAFALLKMVPGLYTTAAAVLALGLGYRAGSVGGVGSDRRRRLVRTSLPVLLALVMGLGGLSYYHVRLAEGRALAALPAAAPGAPNVLLIVLDTVRADHLSVYGYGRDTTPNLARLARRGVVFGEARSAAPWTLPSHASLFTGRWPHELRVAGDRPLDATYPTLAGFLAEHGYATAGFVGNTYFCNSWYGLARGFAHYEDYYEQNVVVSPGEALRCTALGRWLIRVAGPACKIRPETVAAQKDAERVNRDFLRWVAANRGRPFFAFLNYIDAHDPYLTPPGFDRHFGLKPETPADVELIRNWHHRGQAAHSRRDVTLVGDAYDDCLAYLDMHLGRLFDALERDGTLRDTLVVVTSDHGEQLGEHGLHGHGKSLYRKEVHVPLLVVGPTGIPMGRSIADPVSLRDVAATVVERLGLAARSPFPGRSLARCWEPASARGAIGRGEPILSEVSVRDKPAKRLNPKLAPAQLGPMSSILTGGKVYIRDALGREELYDVASDPDEAHDLARSPGSRADLERCRIGLDRLVGGDEVRR